jgi:hypothetical protein
MLGQQTLLLLDTEDYGVDTDKGGQTQVWGVYLC